MTRLRRDLAQSGWKVAQLGSRSTLYFKGAFPYCRPLDNSHFVGRETLFSGNLHAEAARSPVPALGHAEAEAAPGRPQV